MAETPSTTTADDKGAELLRLGNKPRTWIAALLRQTLGEGCVYWPFSKNTWGYGHIRHQKKDWLAHRFICDAVHGPAPFEGALALHSCGNGHLGCVNPNHIRWGTAKENTADAINAGRLGAGEVNANSKLTETSVKQIRQLHRSGESQRAIARRFGVTDGAVRLVVNHRTWAHVQ